MNLLKNLLTAFALFLLVGQTAIAQQFPEGFNYQAVLRDASGNLLVCEPMELKILFSNFNWMIFCFGFIFLFLTIAWYDASGIRFEREYLEKI